MQLQDDWKTFRLMECIFNCVWLFYDIHVSFVRILILYFCVQTAKKCFYNGVEYQHLDSFKDNDECNTCSCNDGTVARTNKKCRTFFLFSTCNSKNRNILWILRRF